MVVENFQKNLIDLIKDADARKVFEQCEKLEEASNDLFWKVKIEFCDETGVFSESYCFDNYGLVDFLQKYYGLPKQITFQTSPDGKRIYLNKEEVDIVGTDYSDLVVRTTHDSYMINLSNESNEYLKPENLYKELTYSIPVVKWFLTVDGIGVSGVKKKFDKIGVSKVSPAFIGEEDSFRNITGVDIVETVLIEPVIKDSNKWVITIETELDIDQD